MSKNSGVIIFFLLSLISCQKSTDYRDGDIIFQVSQTAQSQAIQLATNSKFSHCGIIHKKGNHYIVFEAVQPVKYTPLKEWIKKGQNEYYVIKRLKNRKILEKELSQINMLEEQFKNKDYDLNFEWSDEKLYCSELVWKIYKRALGIELGKPKPLKEFNINHPKVKEFLKKRYGDNVPMDELIISPAAIFNADNLFTVKNESK